MIIKNGKRIDGCSDTVPIGTLNPFLGTTAPYGYLICQGQKVSKTTYKELYEICGDTFGQSTDTEFYLPDLRGQTIAGYKEGDSTFGTLGGLIGSLTNKYTPKGVNTGTTVTLNAVSLSHSGGAVQSHTLTIAEMPSHNHGGSYGDFGTPNASYGVMSNTSGTGAAVVTDYTGGGGGHNHGFTQPSAHSFTPTTKSITQPTFTGTEENISTLQPSINLNWIVKAFQLMPNQSYVSNLESNSKENTYSCDFINTLVNEVKNQVLDSAFPIGKVEVFFDNEDHSNYLGFTWERELEGLTPIGYNPNDTDFNTIGKTLGNKTIDLSHTHNYAHTHGVPGVAHTHTSAAHTHTINGHTHTSAAHTHSINGHTHTTGSHSLTVAELPSHNHKSTTDLGCNGLVLSWDNKQSGENFYGAQWQSGSFKSSGAFALNDLYTSSTGSGTAHSHGNTGSKSLTTNSTTPGATGSTSLTTNSTTPGATGSTTPGDATTKSQSTSITSSSGSTTQSIIQPSEVVAYWRRIA